MAATRPQRAQEAPAPYAGRSRRSEGEEPNHPASPFLKWAGGKSQLLTRFATFYPPAGQVERFIEPFVGGGAVFFHVKHVLRPKRCWLFDRNDELITTYKSLQNDLPAVLELLARHKSLHDEDHYYEVRAQRPETLSEAARAARFIYLNKTCYNGLYRVNSRNEFNVPMGRYVRPGVFDTRNLEAVRACLRGVKLETREFAHVLKVARAGDFIYFDPPYDPVSGSASFTSYTAHSFSREDQEALAEVYGALSARGCHVMLSNSDTPFVRRLYRTFDVHQVPARRAINTRADRRGPVAELVVLNYRPPNASKR